MIKRHSLSHIFYGITNILLAIFEYFIVYKLLLKVNNILAIVVVAIVGILGLGIALYNQFAFPVLVKDETVDDAYLSNLANFVIKKFQNKYNFKKEIKVFILNDFQRPNPAFTLGNDIYIVKKYAKHFSYEELVSLISHELGHVRSTFPNIVFTPLLRLDMLFISIVSNLYIATVSRIFKGKENKGILFIVFGLINFLITLPSIILDSPYFRADEDFANKTAVDLGYMLPLADYYASLANDFSFMEHIYDTFRHPSPYLMNKRMLKYFKKSNNLDKTLYNNYKTIFTLRGYLSNDKLNYSKTLGENLMKPDGLTYNILGELYDGKYKIVKRNFNVSKEFYKKAIDLNNISAAYNMSKIVFSRNFYKPLLNSTKVVHHEFLINRLGNKKEIENNFLYLKENMSLKGLKAYVTYYFNSKDFKKVKDGYDLIYDDTNSFYYKKYLFSKYMLGLISPSDMDFLNENIKTKSYEGLFGFLIIKGYLQNIDLEEAFNHFENGFNSLCSDRIIKQEIEKDYIEIMYSLKKYDKLYIYLFKTTSNLKYLYLALMYDKGLYVVNSDLNAKAYYKVAYKLNVISKIELESYLNNI